jgi:hypothetical protein
MGVAVVQVRAMVFLRKSAGRPIRRATSAASAIEIPLLLSQVILLAAGVVQNQQQYGIVGSIPVKTGRLAVVSVHTWSRARQIRLRWQFTRTERYEASILRATCSGVLKAWIYRFKGD